MGDAHRFSTLVVAGGLCGAEKAMRNTPAGLRDLELVNVHQVPLRHRLVTHRLTLYILREGRVDDKSVHLLLQLQRLLLEDFEVVGADDATNCSGSFPSLASKLKDFRLVRPASLSSTKTANVLALGTMVFRSCKPSTKCSGSMTPVTL